MGNDVTVSIIIPTLNEERNIGWVLRNIPKSILDFSEVVVVDSSTDRTPYIARKLGARVIKAPRLGKGYAMKIGVREAKGDIIVFLDGDGTDPPQYIPLMLKYLSNYDVVICSRNPYVRNGHKAYRFVSMIYMPILRKMFRAIGFNVRGDPLSGFRAMRKETWYLLDLKSNDFFIETEMNIKIALLGLRVLEIPIPCLPRRDTILKSKFLRSLRQEMRVISTLLHIAVNGKQLRRRLMNLRCRIKYRERTSR